MHAGLQATGPSKKAGRGLRLREASFNDHGQVAPLAARHGLSRLSYEEWSHVWRENPVYKQLQPDWSIGWVLENGSGRIVGYIGNVPLSYEFEGRTIVAAASHAWVVEPEYRGAALLLLERVVNDAHAELYVSNTVSVASTPGVCALGCQRVPVGAWDEQAFWVTGYRGVVADFLVRKHVPLAPVFSYPLSAAVLLRDRVIKPAVDGADVDVEECPAFDERFDEFWDDVRRRQRHRLLAVRTREVLAWHFKHALLEDRLWIGTVTDGPRIIAYALLERADVATSPLRVVRLVDFQSLDGSTALLVPLLSWAARKCRDAGIHKLVSVGRWLERGELLDRVAPYRRKLSGWTYWYRARNPRLAERLCDPGVWAPSAFDADASLVRPVSI
ncbi:MAG TPA: hypothetical protein VFS11_01125 [Gemmatimonadales bacterium]|nr:hypothetical protein [Gemmatimonadales bacterium]